MSRILVVSWTVDRILFLPRQRDELGSQGRAPSGVQGQSPLSGGQRTNPLEAESFSVV